MKTFQDLMRLLKQSEMIFLIDSSEVLPFGMGAKAEVMESSLPFGVGSYTSDINEPSMDE